MDGVGLPHYKLSEALRLDFVQGGFFQLVGRIFWIARGIFGHTKPVTKLARILPRHFYCRDDRHGINQFIARNLIKRLDNTIELKGHFLARRFSHADNAAC